MRAGEAAGAWTVEPAEALGRFHSAWSSARLTSATSAPALASRDGVMPRSWRISATARWTGSTWGLPSLTARVLAALITSTLREVSLMYPRQVISCGLLIGDGFATGRTPSKLSPFPSTLAHWPGVGAVNVKECGKRPP